MLLNYSVKGFKVFYDEVHFSMLANKRIRKNSDNIIKQEISGKEISVVKSAILYGPNNSGKSCFLESLKYLVNIIKNEKTNLHFNYNLFSEDNLIKYEIEFLENNKKFYYELTLKIDKIVNEVLKVNDDLIFNKANNDFPDKTIRELFTLVGGYNDKLLVVMLPINKFGEIVSDFKNFFNRFEFVFDDLLNDKTMLNEIGLVSNHISDIKENNMLSEMIKKADIYINEIKIDDTFTKLLDNSTDTKTDTELLKKILVLCTEYNFKGQTFTLPFYTVNSYGTKKMAIFARKVIDALKNNKIIVIDDINHGWHTILTKNLISLFNSNTNSRAQMIMTSHDLLLLDDNYLFRKDQIWFIYKDSDGNYLYCLDDFKDNGDIDARGNVMVRYLKGMFGALPMPNLGDINDVLKENTK